MPTPTAPGLPAYRTQRTEPPVQRTRPRIGPLSDRVRTFALAGLAAALNVGIVAAEAGAQQTIDIRFPTGTTSTTINGTIQGDEYVDYVLTARRGQSMVVSLAVTGTNGNGSAFFNILPAGQDYGGPYTGSNDDDQRAEITVPSDGDWAIRVYLMGNDRDTNRTVSYAIDVAIASGGGGSGGAGSSEAPSGMATVTGVPSNDVLNVRSGPGAGNQIVGALGNGDRVKVLECRDQGRSRWCEIEMMTDMRERGWVNARYLTDGAAPSSPAGANPPIGELRPGSEQGTVLVPDTADSTRSTP